MAAIRISEVVQDRAGNVYGDVNLTVTSSVTGAPVTLFSDKALTAVASQPVRSNSLGEFLYYVASGQSVLLSVSDSQTPKRFGDYSKEWEAVSGQDVGGVATDASTTVKGVSKLSVAPVSPSNPIAVGDNDPRLGAAGVTVADTTTIDLTLSGASQITADVVAGSLTNTHIAAGAGIVKSKLASLAIVDADVAAGAAIALSKLAITGTPTGTKFLRDDGSWQTPAGSESTTVTDSATIDFTLNVADITAVVKPASLTDTHIASGAAIAKSKLAALNIVDADVAAGAAIAKSKLAALNIADSDVAAGAAIAASKLAAGTAGQVLVTASAGPTPTWRTLTGDVTIDQAGVTTIGATKVTNAMLAGSIAYSKLILTGAILNADLAGSIAYSKLILTGSVTNADLAGSIAYSKLSLTGLVVDGDIAAAGITTRTKLPSALAYEDEANTFTQTNTFNGNVRIANLGLGQAANTYRISFVADTVATGGIDWGADIRQYRSAANTLTVESTSTNPMLHQINAPNGSAFTRYSLAGNLKYQVGYNSTQGDFQIYDNTKAVNTLTILGANDGTDLSKKQGMIVLAHGLHLWGGDQQYQALRYDGTTNLLPVAIAAASAGVTNNGSGKVRISTSPTPHGLEGQDVNIYGATPQAVNGRWAPTIINSTTFDLLDLAFTTTGGGGYVQRRDRNPFSYLLLSGRNTNMVNAGRLPSDLDQDSLTSTGSANADGSSITTLGYSSTSARSFTGRGSFVLMGGTYTIDEAKQVVAGVEQSATAFDTYAEMGIHSCIVAASRRGALANVNEFNVFTKKRVGATTKVTVQANAGATSITVSPAPNAALGSTPAFEPSGTIYIMLVSATTGARTWVSTTYSARDGTSFTVPALAQTVPVGSTIFETTPATGTPGGGPARIHIQLNQVWEYMPYGDYGSATQGQFAFTATEGARNWGAIGHRIRNSGTESAGTGLLIEGGELVTGGKAWVRAIVVHKPSSGDDLFTVDGLGNVGVGAYALVNQTNNTAGLPAAVVISPTSATPTNPADGIQFGMTTPAAAYRSAANTLRLDTYVHVGAALGVGIAPDWTKAKVYLGSNFGIASTLVDMVGGYTAGAATLTVDSTAGYPTQGFLQLTGMTGNVTYTGITATTFTGCSGGSGTAADNAVVNYAGGVQDAIVWGSDANQVQIFRASTNAVKQLAIQAAQIGFGTAAPITALNVTATTNSLYFSGGALQIVRGTSVAGVFTTFRGSNTTQVYQLLNDGSMTWGSFSSPASADCTFGRNAAGILKAGEGFHVGGDFRHLGTNLGFYNVAQVARPSAYTQTYATATRTHSNPTATTVTAGSGSAGYTDAAAAAAVVSGVNALIVDVANVKQVLNQVVDDLQAVGLLQ